jgi:hypothetical protein
MEVFASLTPTPAEEKLIKAAYEGRIEDYSDRRSEDTGANDPAQGARWGPERTIRAGIIYALVVGTNPVWPVHSKGVQAAGAKIVGALDFRAAKITCPLVLIKCFVEEPIELIDATAETIALYGSHVSQITAFRLVTSGSILLNKGFVAEQGVELCAANIGGDFDCEGGTLRNPSGPALFADGLRVQGNIFLRASHFREGQAKPFQAIGEVRLVGAHIHGDLDCSGGVFEGGNSRALSADRVSVDGEICLRNGFRAKGGVRLLGGELRGNLDCAQSAFENPDGTALDADSLSVGGGVLLWRGFQARGAVRLVGARIEGDLNCTNCSLSAEATLKNPHGLALSIDRAQMGELFFRKMAHPPSGVVSFLYAKASLLSDDAQSWPEAGRLWLDGFVYDTIAAGAPIQAKDRLNWLARQPKDNFWPQPYEQLTYVLRRMGHQRDARKIAIAKQRALRRSGQLGKGARIWNLFLGATIGHGYRPLRAMLWMLLVVVIGTGVFWQAGRVGLMMPSNEAVYHEMAYDRQGGVRQPHWQPDFQPAFYSVDVFLPFVDLHQKSSWWLHQRMSPDWAFLVCESYFLVHTSLGWLLTGLLVAALTGLIKKD